MNMKWNTTYLIATFLQVLLAGSVFLEFRSSDKNALLWGLSLSRLTLLLGWILVVFGLIALIFCLITKRILLDQLIQHAMVHFVFLRNVFSFLVLLFFGGILVFIINPDAWIFIWPGTEIVFRDIGIAIIIFSIWLLQTLLYLLFLQAKRTGHQFLSVFTSTVFLPEKFVFILVVVFSFWIYTLTAVDLNFVKQNKAAYFPQLAQSFLDGRLDLLSPKYTKDLTLYNGKYYVSFPPGPALFMLPFVAMSGPDSLNVLRFTIFFASLGAGFMFLGLESLRKQNKSYLNRNENLILTLFFAFGTVQYYLTMWGLVNIVSQVFVGAFVALSLWAILASDPNKADKMFVYSGLGLALAILGRPNVIFLWFGLMLILWDKHNLRFSSSLLKQSVLVSFPVGVSIMGLMVYNQLRFGSFFDFGYMYMLVADSLKTDLMLYGQFNWFFFFRNFYDNILRLPYWDTACQRIVPDWHGMSFFIVSPLFIYLLQSFKRQVWSIGLWASVFIIFIIHMTYYNSGALQFGYRFSLDFLPVLMILLASGFRRHLPVSAYFLVGVSILVNYIGVLWIARDWCVNW